MCFITACHCVAAILHARAWINRLMKCAWHMCTTANNLTQTMQCSWYNRVRKRRLILYCTVLALARVAATGQHGRVRQASAYYAWWQPRAGCKRNPPTHPHVSPQQMVLEDGSLDAAPEHRLRHLLPPIKEALACYQAWCALNPLDRALVPYNRWSL